MALFIIIYGLRLAQPLQQGLAVLLLVLLNIGLILHLHPINVPHAILYAKHVQAVLTLIV